MASGSATRKAVTALAFGIAVGSAATLLRSDGQPAATNAPPPLRLSTLAPNRSVRTEELPSTLAMTNHVDNRYGNMFVTQTGEIFKDETKCIEVKVKAVEASGFIGITYLLNGKTDQGWWYQFGLGYSTNFFIAIDVFDDKGVPRTPPFYLPYDCRANDKVDLRMSITNGYVVLQAEDQNREALIHGEGNGKGGSGKVVYFKAVGDRFVCPAVGDATEICTEVQSAHLVDHIPVQDYNVVQPKTLGQVEFFMLEVNVPKGAWGAPKSARIVDIGTGWIDATPSVNALYETGTKENSVRWKNAYSFETGTFDPELKLSSISRQ